MAGCKFVLKRVGVVSLNGFRLFLPNVSLDYEMRYFNPGAANVSDSPLIQADTIVRSCKHLFRSISLPTDL